MRGWVWAVAALVCVVGCGKKNSGSSGVPTTPTPPAPTVVGLALSPAFDLVMLNATQAITATASLSDGSSAVVTPAWTVNPPAVATVANGLVTGRVAGEAVLTADHQGARASRPIRVLPDMAGSWSGRYRVVSCTDSIDWRGICDDEDTTVFWRLDFDLTQDRDAVTGHVGAYADLPMPSSGSIAVNGELGLTGMTSYTSSGFVFEMRLRDWKSVTLDNQTMSGTFTIVESAPKFQGDFRLMCEMTAVKAGKFLGAVRETTAPASDPFRRPRVSP